MKNQNVVEVEVDYAADLEKFARHYGLSVYEGINPDKIHYEYSGRHADLKLLPLLGKITRKMICTQIEKDSKKLNGKRLSDLTEEMKKNGFRPADPKELLAFAGQHGKDKGISFASSAITQKTRGLEYTDHSCEDFRYIDVHSYLIVNEKNRVTLVRYRTYGLDIIFDEEMEKSHFVFVSTAKETSPKKMFRVTYKEAEKEITNYRYISRQDGFEAEYRFKQWNEKIEMVEAYDIEDVLIKLPGLTYDNDVKIEEVKVIS